MLPSSGAGQWDYISGKGMTANLTFSQNAGYIIDFHAKQPMLSESTLFFTSENLWGIMDGSLSPEDLDAWFTLVEDLQTQPLPSQAVSVKLCTTESIQDMWQKGNFEARRNAPRPMLVFNTKTRLKELLGKLPFGKTYIAADPLVEKSPVGCVQKYSLDAFSPIDWKVGPSRPVKWLFKNQTYPEFPTKIIQEWTFQEHISCNNAIDRGWVDVQTGSDPRDFGTTACRQTAFPYRSSGTLLKQLSDDKYERAKQNTSRSIHAISRPKGPTVLAATRYRESSLPRAPNPIRQYFDVSNQVRSWVKGKPDSGVSEVSIYLCEYQTACSHVSVLTRHRQSRLGWYSLGALAHCVPAQEQSRYLDRHLISQIPIGYPHRVQS